ncbi:MAG: NAD(P)(+) transhydrogenase (Re/Si-specific) subunit beta [Bacteroidales bacterium]|nr:NAD(P)(+) transhydrogenase (Re/Si-specific) subunit beta [Bacteroidales bacterium]
MPFEITDAGMVFLDLSYLIAAVMFVIGLKMLSRPDKARAGNVWAAAGMLLAMITTLIFHKNAEGQNIAFQNILLVLAVIAVASVMGIVIARRVKMTAMPQLVSLFNATGGIASALVALIESGDPGNNSQMVTLLGMATGSIAFSGSLIAYGKLDGKIRDWLSPLMKYINLSLLLILIAMIVFMLLPMADPGLFKMLVYVLFFFSIVYGITFVMPIGGADMPVVISLLNALTGIAAALAGFIYSNQAMILGGILVGAAGMVLTLLMCRAMNRSLLNVIVGSFGGHTGEGGRQVAGSIREISLSDAGILLNYSQKVVIVPGYGLAAAQAQHICSELDTLLSDRGVDVRYAIHPVAGRMPGHMNVLLAEANVPYEKLVEMDHINPDMPNVDVVIVIGANDVVNPAALDDPSGPIYGMPIILAHAAKNIIVIKRGMGKGYAAIENSLFFNDKTRMLFGHAKEILQKLVTEIKGME